MHLLCFRKVELYERMLLYKIFIQSFIVVNFNVSSTKLIHTLNFLDMFSVGITFGIRAGRFRSCLRSLSYNKGSGTIEFRVNVLVVVVS
jgi:hypothetical protein